MDLLGQTADWIGAITNLGSAGAAVLVVILFLKDRRSAEESRLKIEDERLQAIQKYNQDRETAMMNHEVRMLAQFQTVQEASSAALQQTAAALKENNQILGRVLEVLRITATPDSS